MGRLNFLKEIFRPTLRTIASSIKYPQARVGYGARIRGNSKVGKNVKIGPWSIINNSKLSDYVFIERNNMITDSSIGKHTNTGQNTVIKKKKIGAFTSISWNVTIGAGEHDYKRITSHEMLYMKRHGFIKEPVYHPNSGGVQIGNDVWIGANATILQNVKVGDGAVIGAGAVVTKDVPDYAIVVGIPAKVIKYRFNKKVIKLLKEIKWWGFPDDVIKKNIDLLSSKPTKDVLMELLEISKKLNRG